MFLDERKRNPGYALIGLRTTAPCRTSIAATSFPRRGCYCYCTSKTERFYNPVPRFSLPPVERTRLKVIFTRPTHSGRCLVKLQALETNHTISLQKRFRCTQPLRSKYAIFTHIYLSQEPFTLSPTSSPGRFSLALEVGREKALASTGRSVIVIG